MIAILYDNVEINGKEYNKDKFFEFLIQERKNSKIKYIKSREGYGYTEYTLKRNLELIKVCFPDFNSIENAEYENIISKWASYDRRKNLVRLKIAGIILASSVATAKIVENSDVIIEPIKEFIDDQKSNWNSFQTNRTINNLEDELIRHTGHGEIDGYVQSIEEHLKGHCYLGKPDSRQEIYEAISEYCEDKGLGENVADAACEKYEYMLSDEMYKANEIDLKKVYKNGKQKVHTNN